MSWPAQLWVTMLLAALLAHTPPASAKDDGSDSKQTQEDRGDTNSHDDGSEHGDGGTGIDQILRNDSFVTQHGANNTATVNQQAYRTGGGSDGEREDGAHALETGLIGNWAKIYQDGYMNTAAITQSGTDNAAEIDQKGSYDHATISQTGSGHESTVKQTGSGLQVDIQQTGAGRQFDITQTRQGNITIRQNGGDGSSPPISIVEH